MKTERLYPFLVVAILLLLVGSGGLAFVFFRMLGQEGDTKTPGTEQASTSERPRSGLRSGFNFGSGERSAPGHDGAFIKWSHRKPELSPMGVGPNLNGWTRDEASGYYPDELGYELKFDELCEDHGGEFSLLATGADIQTLLEPALLCLKVDRPTINVPKGEKRTYTVADRTYDACDLDRDAGSCIRIGNISPEARGREWHPMYAPTPVRPRQATNVMEEWHAPFMGLLQSKSSASREVESQTAGGTTASATRTTRNAMRNYYFLSSNPHDWFADLPIAASATRRDIQPGIDLHVYTDQNRLEYVYTFWPEVDPVDVEMNYDDAYSLRLADNDNLLVEYDCATLVQHRPFAYRWNDGQPIPVWTRYEINGNTVRLTFPDRSENKQALEGTARRIRTGPELEHFSYLGGEGDDQGYAVATDGRGYAYVAGSTTSDSFAAGKASTPKESDNVDIFVTKYRLSDRTPIYTTIIGGRHEDRAFDLAADSAGNVYICGETLSPDFAAISPPPGNVLGRGWDAFVTKLDKDGRLADFAFRFGGGGDDRAYGIILDSATNVYIVGTTESDNFPQTNATAGLTRSGGKDAFVTKFDASGRKLLYSACVGGEKDDLGYAIGLDPSGAIVIAGETSSKDFPVHNSLQNVHGGGTWDGFILKLTPDTQDTVFATYLGGQSDERVFDLDIDFTGNITVCGETASEDFPLSRPVQTRFAGGDWDAFVTKFPPAGNKHIYSTLLGGSGDDRGFTISLDVSGRAHIAGTTSSTNLPTIKPIQKKYGGGQWDAFISKLSVDGSKVHYQTYIGSQDDDRILDLCSEGGRNLLVAGNTASRDLLVVKPLQSSHRGGENDALTGRVKPEPFAAPPMNAVPAGGQVAGPAYDFHMSRYEIRNEDFVKFLNDAQSNPDGPRGTNMIFDARGNVWFNTEMKSERDELFIIHDSRLIYRPDLPSGARYHVTSRTPQEGGSYMDHPSVGVSWYGAVKYCNWLTLETGRGESQRCYREGWLPSHWAPVTCSTDDWEAGIFSGEQRLKWLAFRGFRLPMDNSEAPQKVNDYFRVTNDEFTDYLNDLESTPNALRSTNVYFDVEGNVYFSPERKDSDTLMFAISESLLIYSPGGQISSRYAVTPEQQPDNADANLLPIVGVTWPGAMKYCNWLSILDELERDQLSYREGENIFDWAPATASVEGWRDGRFTERERRAWVELTGYRLPHYSDALPPEAYALEMTNQLGRLSFANAFNEFYKAATHHAGSNNNYGFGRSAYRAGDANFLDARGPGRRDTTKAGFYDGSTQESGFQTTTNDNMFGIYDLSGNVTEWLSDPGQAGSIADRACYGGSWMFDLPRADNRFYVPPYFTDNFRGFRVVSTVDSEEMHIVRIPFRLCICGYGVGAGCERGEGAESKEGAIGKEEKTGKSLEVGVGQLGHQGTVGRPISTSSSSSSSSGGGGGGGAGESPGDDLSNFALIKMCFNDQTIDVPFGDVNTFLMQGAQIGRCLPEILANNLPLRICHVPTGNPSSPQTIIINANAWLAHQANHACDYIGTCPNEFPTSPFDVQVCFCPPGTDPTNAASLWIPQANFEAFITSSNGYYGVCANEL